MCENIFVSSSFLKNIFAVYRILGWQLFSFSTLKLLYFIFITFIASTYNSDFGLIMTHSKRFVSLFGYI